MACLAPFLILWLKFLDHILKVSRKNFKPQPAVDSSVVRLVPKVPRPQISYEEWDGLLRMLVAHTYLWDELLTYAL